MKSNVSLKLEWLSNLNKEQILFVTLEYRYFVKRFVPWLALVIARTNDIKIRQFLIQNLYEECGLNIEESHLFMLDKIILSMGFEGEFDIYHPYEETKKLEYKLYSTFNCSNIYKSLCFLGPSTEKISHLFLFPLKEAIKNSFKINKLDYFDIHLSEIERGHAEQFDLAILHMEKNNITLKKNKEKYIEEGLKIHKQFWDNLKVKIYEKK